MAIAYEPSDPRSLLQNPEIIAHLALTGRDIAALHALLEGASDQGGAAAQTPLTDLRRRLDVLERQDREATARPEYQGEDVVWSYTLSEPTRACLRLLTALETTAGQACDRAA